MTLSTLVGSSISTLLSQKRRSVSTMISLAWAVASFLLLVSYGRGFDAALQEAFYAVGQDIVLMTSGQTSEQAGGMRAGRAIYPLETDIEQIREAVPLVGGISPEMMFNVTAARSTRQKEYMARAVRPEYDRIRNINLLSGRWINADDDSHARRVAVLGAEVAKAFFGNSPESGEEILINGVRFVVIGRLKTKVQLANYNRPDNESIFIPYETSQLFQDTRYPHVIIWSPITPAARERAVRQVRTVMAGIHHFSPTDEKAIFTLEFRKFSNIIEGMSLALNSLLAFIGAITLGIGAVGLANIMLTSVIERTREIGIMKAVGARRRSILCQFLMEAIFIVMAGGALGVALGALVASVLGSLPAFGVLLGEQFSKEYGRIYFHLSASAVAISVGILLLVGLIAGIIPAVRASRMDPVKALHYE
ncbi:MAG: efflux pump, inner rane subunit [Acidobacteria bacterium]|jgi:putative ABC transport system permease protein|nr:efflux pump, inner rane subunit [Acidobacteriota bacterium]